jgi:hypothetical protein
VGDATRRSDTARGVGRSAAREAPTSTRLCRRTITPTLGASARRAGRPAGEPARTAGGTPCDDTRSLLVVRASLCSDVRAPRADGDAPAVSDDASACVASSADARGAPPDVVVVSSSLTVESAGGGLDAGGSADGGATGAEVVTGSGIGTGCAAAGGGEGGGGEGAGGGLGTGLGVGAGAGDGAGGGAAARAGSSEAGSTYFSSAPTRTPRCKYGVSCSGSPDGPPSATTSPSLTYAPRFTVIRPTCVSEALNPSAVAIVTVRPCVGTWPAKVTSPETGARTEPEPPRATSIPRCWPAAYSSLPTENSRRTTPSAGHAQASALDGPASAARARPSVVRRSAVARGANMGRA